MAKRVHPWEEIDPLLLDGKSNMMDISRKYKIPYRQVTNRKYAVRNRLIKAKLLRIGKKRKVV